MAENKKSFLMYADFIDHFEDLTDLEAGQLIKHIFRYVNDKNPTPPDRIIQVAFNPIKQSLKRDLVKWEGIKEKKSDAGKASAEAKRLAKEESERIKNLTQSTPVDYVGKNSTHSTVSVSDSVSVSVSDILLEKETKDLRFSFDDFWGQYPKKIAKPKCEAAFKNLKAAEKDIIAATLGAYLNYKPFPTYSHPNPLTYLNQKRWTDVYHVNDIEVKFSCEYSGAFGKSKHNHTASESEKYLLDNQHMKLSTKNATT